MPSSFIKKSVTLLSLIILPLSVQQAYADITVDEIPAPYHVSQKSSEGFKNEMLILNHGITAFWKRIELIRNAKKNIEVEYFIYALDETSKAFTSELVKAAERGVKVRVLIDKSAAVFVFDKYYAKALKEKGVEVKYYNDASLIRVSTVNFRNHRKLMSVDDEFAITGGRNIENDYFDYSEEFNFLDRDVLVKGDLAKPMRESFDKFWDNKLSVTPKFPKRPKDRVKKWTSNPHGKGRVFREVDNQRAVKKYLKLMAKAQDFITPNQETELLIEKFERSALQLLEGRKLVECPEATYATDAPGATFMKRLVENYSDKYRFLRKVMNDKAIGIDHEIVLSSPYVINSPKTRDIYESFLKNDVNIKVYTNSLASTDAVYVAANLYTYLRDWVEKGIHVSLHPGVYQNFGEEMVVDVTKAKWGTHSKTQLYKFKDASQNEFMIGTYNYDNRSSHYNTEMALFCKGSPELFAEVENSINERVSHAYKVDENKKAHAPDGKKVSIYGASKDGLFLMRLIGLPSVLLQLLL